jgi:hypothetical protein
MATERYQLEDYYEDHYATPTDRYVDLRGAFRCLCEDASIQLLDGEQTELFEWWQHI